MKKTISFDEAKVGDMFIDEKNGHYSFITKKRKTFFYNLEYVWLKVLRNDGWHYSEKVYKHEWDRAMRSDFLMERLHYKENDTRNV